MALPVVNRLRRPSEFRDVLGGAHSNRRIGGVAGDQLLRIAAVSTDRSESRVGLSVSKRVGGSVVRNRVKRRLREIFSELVVKGSVGERSWDIVATARPEAAQATYEELWDSAKRLVSKVMARG